MNPTNDPSSVTWGKTSWLALIAALAQFAAAIVIYLFAPDDQKAGAIAPLVTAASTLYALVKGRNDQAAAKLAPAPVVPPPVNLQLTSTPAPEEPEPEDKVSSSTPEFGALGGPEDPVHVDEDLLDPAHEERDLHDGEQENF
jgi:hypothetical protein